MKSDFLFSGTPASFIHDSTVLPARLLPHLATEQGQLTPHANSTGVAAGPSKAQGTSLHSKWLPLRTAALGCGLAQTKLQLPRGIFPPAWIPSLASSSFVVANNNNHEHEEDRGGGGCLSGLLGDEGEGAGKALAPVGTMRTLPSRREAGNTWTGAAGPGGAPAVYQALCQWPRLPLLKFLSLILFYLVVDGHSASILFIHFYAVLRVEPSASPVPGEHSATEPQP